MTHLEHLFRNLLPKSEKAVKNLKTEIYIKDKNLIHLCNAGMKSEGIQFGLFGRDQLTNCLMLNDMNMLKDTIEFCFLTRGKGNDPITGEEPYRVIHELPGTDIRGLNTSYNACDTTALLLIGLVQYYQETGEKEFLNERRSEIKGTLDYLLSHIKNGLYWEDPKFCGASKYALKATYWKDSGLPGIQQPCYPVVYTLVQAQVAAALRGAAKLSTVLEIDYHPQYLEKQAEALTKSIFTQLWDGKREYPVIARDREGGIAGISSDGLHMLAYLPRELVPKYFSDKIFEKSKSLETPYGFRTYAPDQPGYHYKSYHWGSIWPFDQFFIAKGALVHQNERVLNNALKMGKGIDEFGFPELFYFNGKKLTPSSYDNPPQGSDRGGCDLQLWSAAYVQGINKLIDEL